MCPLSHSNLLMHLVTKYLLHIYCMEGTMLANVRSASNLLSLILYNKTYIGLTVCQVLS